MQKLNKLLAEHTSLMTELIVCERALSNLRQLVENYYKNSVADYHGYYHHIDTLDAIRIMLQDKIHNIAMEIKGVRNA